MARIALAISLVAVVVTVLASASLGRSGPGPARAATPSGRQQFPFSTDRWVVVKYDGTVVYRSPGVVSATRTRKGDYVITFFRPVLNCAWLATIRTFTVGGDEPSAVEIKAETHYVGTAPNLIVDPRSIEVVTFNDAGANAGLADASFSVKAVC